MDSAEPRTSKRLLRILLAGGILAAGWFVADSVLSSSSASADVIDDTGAIVETITTPLTPVVEFVAPVVELVETPVASIVAPVGERVESPLSPVLTPIVTQVVQPIVTPILDPLAPILDPVVGVVAPVVEPLTPLVPAVVDLVVPTVEAAAGNPVAAQAVAPVGAVLIGVATAIAIFPPVAPRGSANGPLGSPVGAPVFSGTAAVLSGSIAFSPGISASSGSAADALPASPTFDSDTTPD